jgi:TamB, inner membrane protein subunit of TAM complex/AsmA family
MSSEPPIDPPTGQPPAAPDTPPPAGKPRRKRSRVRRWVVRPFLWGIVLLVALLAGVYFLLQSQLARGRAASLVVQRVSAYLHRDIQVGAVDYTFFPLAFELHDLVIPGPRPDDPPVATIPLVRIQSSWRDLRQQVLNLEQIEVVSPRIYLQFNPDGTSNLPEFGSDEPTGPSRFEFRLGRILVQDGTLRINQRELPLNLDARAVWARALGTAEGKRLDILATAQEVVTTLPDARPYPLTVSARGSLFLDGSRLDLSRVRLAGPGLAATASGTLALKEPRRYEIRLDAEGAAELLNRLGYLEDPITGPFRFAGNVDIVGDDVRYGGRLQSPRLAFLDRVFEGVDAQLDGTPERLLIDLQRVGYAGGTVGGEVTVDVAAEGVPEAAGKPVTLDLAFSGLGLEPLIRDQELPIDNLTGTADGTFRYRFTSSAPLAGTGDGDVRLRAREAQSGLPLDGRVPLTLAGGVLRIDGARVTAPSQEVAVAGSYNLEGESGRFQVQLDTADLGGLMPLIRLDPSPEPPAWLPTAGRGRAEADLAVTAAGIEARITLALQDVASPGLAFDGLRGGFRYRPQAVEDLDVTAERGAGTLAVRGRIPLPQEGRGISGGAPLALVADLRDWPAASLAALVPGAPPLAGTVTAEANVGGTFDRLNGRALATVEELGVEGNRIGRVRADLAFDGPAIRIQSATVEMPAGTVLVEGRFDRAAERISLVVDAPGLNLSQEPLSAYVKGLTGEATLAASVEGPLAAPQATLRLAGSGLALSGRPLGEAGRAEVLATWNGATVQASGSLLGLLAFEGGGRLDRRGADVAFQLGSDNLTGLARLSLQQGVPEFEGSFNGQATATADFGAGTYRAELALAELVARYEGREIRNLEPVVVALTADRLQIQSVYLGEAGAPEGQETELFVNGSIGLGGEQTPLDLRIQSTLAVQWAELFAPEGFDLAGNVDLLATVRGTVSDPQLSGQGVLRGARVVVPQFPHSIENITGTLLFNRSQVAIENLQARIGGGRLLASGRLDLPQEGRPFEYRLQVAASDLSLRYPEGFLIRGDADIALVANGTGRQIRGTVDLERAFYLEDVELGTFQLIRQVLQRDRLEVAETDPVLAATTLNVLVRGPGALRVRNNIADLRGDIDLTVRGTLARPVVFGRVEIARGGELTYADNEYEIERGLLTFSNPYRIDPVIDLTAHTEVKNFEITLNLSGTLDRLNTDFTTDAGLADLEVIALLATGQELQEQGTLQTGQGGGGGGFDAQEFLAGQAASVVSKRVGKLFGFDRFRISPVEGESSSSVSGVGITVGKRISRDLFVTYTSRPTAIEGDLLQAEWQVANNILLVLTAQENNTYAVDIQWERRF